MGSTANQERFGTTCGVSKKNKKLADRIIRANMKNKMAGSSFSPMMQPAFMPMGNLVGALPTPPPPMHCHSPANAAQFPTGSGYQQP